MHLEFFHSMLDGDFGLFVKDNTSGCSKLASLVGLMDLPCLMDNAGALPHKALGHAALAHNSTSPSNSKELTIPIRDFSEHPCTFPACTT